MECINKLLQNVNNTEVNDIKYVDNAAVNDVIKGRFITGTIIFVYYLIVIFYNICCSVNLKCLYKDF